MKSRFTTVDIVSTLKELQSLLGMRLINVYDIDNKTYLFKLSRKEEKAILLAESGLRLHTTDFEWPKNPAPSSFTMKLRKHIHNRRLESVKQVGVDRIVDMQFGSSEAAYHVILELYDKGNIVLTDYQYTILNILRPRTAGEDLKFVVRNVYPVENAKQPEPLVSPERLSEIVLAAKIGDNLKRLLNPHFIYGPALIEHVLLGAGFNDNAKIGKGFNITEDLTRLLSALQEAEDVMGVMGNSEERKGFIIQKNEKRPGDGGEMTEFLVYHEFHPFLFRQHENLPHADFPSFSKAVDEFFSKIEGQKIDMKAFHQEKDALKKLENVKKDHERRIVLLEKSQEDDKQKAQLIEMNLELVDKAILIIQSAIANQVSWKEIGSLIQEAKTQGDVVAKAIKSVKLEINHITMLLSNPYFIVGDEAEGENIIRLIDIDLDLSAYANAKKYYDLKRHAAKKEQKTIESSTKAFKSAEKKTKQALKDVATVTNIKKARKVHWFEKFYWFISSENYLVIGGRDQQQNEIIVKRYLRPGDVYVHADLHGASSIVIKNGNGTGHPISPKTLNEAGTMAVCYSSAWDAKVVTSAWWVYHDQVSKTAPSGEYLTTGSFMIRGKKNYLPPCHLIMGFGILFKLDEESVSKHKDERKVRSTDEDANEFDQTSMNNEAEIPLDESSDEETAVKDDENVKETESANSKNLVANTESSQGHSEHSAEEEEDFQSSFPDTVVELEHIQGDQYLMRHRTISTTSGVSSVSQDAQDDVVFLGDSQPVPVHPSSRQKSIKQPHPKKNDPVNAPKQLSEKKNMVDLQEKPTSKRGQKFKLKKMKDKYKDQDEGDRQLALQVLQPGGTPKEPKHKKNKTKKGNPKPVNVMANTNTTNTRPGINSVIDPTPTNEQPEQKKLVLNETLAPVNVDQDGGQDSDEEKEKTHMQEDAVLLASLTGQPLPDDVLLYGIPVCGPYNSIMNYKFKVKLIPGTGKRGKAAKTAIAMHLHDRSVTSREKDLIKSLKDQDVSRNIPGKVKMSSQAAHKK